MRRGVKLGVNDAAINAGSLASLVLRVLVEYTYCHNESLLCCYEFADRLLTRKP
jgi:hypothetical protein